MSKTHDEIVKEVFDRDKALRRMALEFIVQNVPVHGNRTTLRALQLCFIAGYEAGHHEAWNEFRRGKLFENDEDAKAAYKEALEDK